MGPFVSYAENEVLGMKPQHLNFFENYDWADKARAFFRAKTFKLCVMLYISLLESFLRLEKHEVL